MCIRDRPYRVINNWLHTKAPYTGSNPHITFLIHRYNLVDPAVGANPAPDVLATVGYLFGEWGTVGDVDGDTFDDLIIYEMLNIGTPSQTGLVNVHSSASGQVLYSFSATSTYQPWIFDRATSPIESDNAPLGDLTGDGVSDFALHYVVIPLSLIHI